MIFKPVAGLGAAILLSLGLSACADQYGYGSLSAGYGDGYGDYYGDPYHDGYGSGYGYAPSYFGWYGDYFYPGTGIYVYDQYRRPYRWNGVQQRYWSARQRYRGNDWNGQGSWNGFDRRTLPGNDGRPWQGRRENQDWRNARRNYVPNPQGWRGTAPGNRTFVPGAPGNRPAPDGRGYRRDPGAQKAPPPRVENGAQFGGDRAPPPPRQMDGGERAPNRDVGERPSRRGVMNEERAQPE